MEINNKLVVDHILRFAHICGNMQRHTQLVHNQISLYCDPSYDREIEDAMLYEWYHVNDIGAHDSLKAASDCVLELEGLYWYGVKIQNEYNETECVEESHAGFIRDRP